MKAKLPLLRIGFREIEEHDQTTLLEFMLQRFTAWQEEQEEILQEIQEYIDILDPQELEFLTEGGILDPSIDPTVVFDFRYPFSGILKVARRLYAHFGIFTTHMMSSLRSIYTRTQSPIVCYVDPVSSNYSDGYNVKQTYSFSVFRTAEPIKELRWTAGKLSTPGINIMFEGTVDFSMQWTLPVVKNFEKSKSKNTFEYFRQKDELPYAFSDVPGIHIPDIASWFCNYLALREVEKWAQKNLKKR